MNKPMKIWTLEDNLIDKIVETYIDYVTNPFSIHRQTPEWFNKHFGNDKLPPEERALRYDKTTQASMDYGDDNLPVTVDNLPTPQRERVRAHFISLIHQLYLRHISNEDGRIILSSDILQKVYRHYNYMLEALTFKLVIKDTHESIGKFARNVYYINEDIEKKFKPKKNCKNRIVIEDIEKFKLQFKKLHIAEVQNAIKLTSLKFIDNYNKSLKTYHLNDYDEVQKVIDNSNTFESIKARRYYEHIVELIKEEKIKEIYKADKNGRIYHIVTQTPRILRKYSNIQYIIDARNSHPLLFNYFIYEYYFNIKNININNNNFLNNNNSLYYLLSNYIYNNQYIINTNSHYFSKNLCKYLSSKNIEGDKIAIVKKIPKDVWAYLSSTIHGKLWDEFYDLNPSLTRNEVKVTMFSSLFYSNSRNIRRDNEYGMSFKLKYPTVTKIIRYHKKTYLNQCIEQGLYTEVNLEKKFVIEGKELTFYKGKVQIAHKLMQIESFIFTEILTRLYKKRTFRGVAIHDAIAILDTTTNAEDVRKIMEKVYSEIGLCPTFSIENSDSDCGTIYNDSEVKDLYLS